MLRLSDRGKSRAKTITLPNWAFGLMAAGSAALGIAIFLVISTLAVLLLPLVLIAGGVTAFMMRKRIERMLARGGFGQTGARPEDLSRDDMAGPRPRRRAAKATRPDIEDAEYRVVPESTREREPEPRR
jgi:hypothetical protein